MIIEASSSDMVKEKGRRQLSVEKERKRKKGRKSSGGGGKTGRKPGKGGSRAGVKGKVRNYRALAAKMMTDSDSDSELEEQMVSNKKRGGGGDNWRNFDPDMAICKFYDCLYTPDDYWSWKEHLKYHPKMEFSCTNCSKVFTCKENLLDHAKTHFRQVYYDATGVSLAKSPHPHQ